MNSQRVIEPQCLPSLVVTPSHSSTEPRLVSPVLIPSMKLVGDTLWYKIFSNVESKWIGTNSNLSKKKNLKL